MSEQITSKLVTYAVFLVTLSIIGVSIISVIFPALIISNTYEFPLNLDPFETSPWLFPIIISNVLLISIGILFYKKKLPLFLNNALQFVLDFEVSKKIAIIAGIVILTIYIGLSIPELSINEIDQWPDFLVLQSALNIWPSTDHFSIYVKEQNTRYVRMALLDFSEDFFQNIKFLPFLASISVVILTALITIQLTKKRFAGLISMLVLLQSVTFTDFDTIAVYENFWVLFYLISIYSIYKKWWYASPLSYILSIFTKAFVATYFWINIFYIYRTNIPKKSKIFLLSSYGIIIVITYVIFESGRNIIYDEIIRFNFDSFLNGFTGWGNSMQMDPFAILFILPLIVGLFIKSLNGVKQADSILVLIVGTILAGPFISFVTDFYFILPYRFIPFIVAIAIGTGIFLSREN